MAKRERIDGIINRIAKIGIEVEGGWDNPVPGTSIVHDGSVVFNAPRLEDSSRYRVDSVRLADGRVERRLVVEPSTAPAPAQPATPQPQARPILYKTGEIVSGTFKPSGVEWKEWVRQCYPQHVNDSCGLHIHMSFFHAINYERLMCPEYTEFIVRALQDFAMLPGNTALSEINSHYYSRIFVKTHKHCAHVYRGDRQCVIKNLDYHSKGTEYDRYTAINYPHAKHRTVECRLLPMFGGQPTTPADVEQAIRALQYVITATNTFLSRCRQKEKKVGAVVHVRPEIVQEFQAWVR